MKLFSIILSLLVFTSCFHQKVKEIFLIPKGFEGRINVIFNQPNFPSISVEEGRWIYKIPNDGILVTSSKLRTGKLDQEYYYVDNSGKKMKIEVKSLSDQSIPDSSVIDNYGVTGVYGNSSDENPLEYIESILASRNTNHGIYNQENEKTFYKLVMKKVGRQF